MDPSLLKERELFKKRALSNPSVEKRPALSESSSSSKKKKAKVEQGGSSGSKQNSAKNWKLRGCPSIGEWLNKLWYMNVMEYYCAIRNDEEADFRKTWEDLYGLMLSEVSRTKRTLYTITAPLCDD